MYYPITGNRIDAIDLAKWNLDTSCQLSLLRADLNHIDLVHQNSKLLTGNKLYKIKYNIHHIKNNKLKGIITFGGAYSNHLHAVAAAGTIFNFKTIGVVRGEEWKNKTNPTLNFCISAGMELQYWSRTAYKQKTATTTIEQLTKEYPKYCMVPEGGNNYLALKGTKEILDNTTAQFDIIGVPIGTGGTLSGIYLSKQKKQQIIGFASVAMPFETALNKILTNENALIKNDVAINYDYTFGGFAKHNQELIAFINRFKVVYNIPLEPLYTAKMLFGIFKMLENGNFKNNQKILAIHTGGLQGIKGFNQQNENCLH